MTPDRIVILTGAGVSAESGLDTFRSAGGIWSQVNLEDVATPEGFARDPEKVLAFYNMRRANLARVEPNAAHRALARLEADAGAAIITQNVDNLHERGGASDVIHMHGTHVNATCNNCRAVWPAPESLSVSDHCPECGANAVRPDVVWFGEMPYELDRIAGLLEEATVFASIGTSGQVYPAAGFVQTARAAGAWCVELNLEKTEISRMFHETRLGPATEIVPAWVDEMLEKLRH